MALKKTMSIKDRWGNYHVTTKEFESEEHFDNWFDNLMSRGSKVIGFF